MNIHSFTDNPQFYGRRRGRKLSKSGQLAIKYGKDYLIKEKEISSICNYQKHIVLEIGFGDGENLVNSAKINSNFSSRLSLSNCWIAFSLSSSD